MYYLEVAVAYIYIFFIILLLPYIITKHNHRSLKIITVITLAQNFICILASNVCGEQTVHCLILYKELVFYGTFFYAIIEKRKLNLKRYFLPLYLFILLMFVYMAVGSTSLYARLICFRQLMTPFILVLYGTTIVTSIKDINKYIKFAMNLGVVIAIFGIFERFILGDSFWIKIDIQNYYDIRGFSTWVLGDLPGNYYSFDFYTLIGTSIRRLVGFLCDPLLTAHYLAFCFSFLLFIRIYDKKYIQNIVIILFGFTILATLCKGAILIVGILIGAKIYKINRKLGTILVLALFAFAIGIIRHNIFDTVARHVNGLISSLSHKFILGSGIGNAGNYAKLYGGESATSGESYIGMLIGQMGILAAIIFIYAFYKSGRYILKYNQNNYIYNTVIYIVAVLIEALVSESAISYVGSGVAFIFFGVCITQTYVANHTKPINETSAFALNNVK